MKRRYRRIFATRCAAASAAAPKTAPKASPQKLASSVQTRALGDVWAEWLNRSATARMTWLVPLSLVVVGAAVAVWLLAGRRREKRDPRLDTLHQQAAAACEA